MLKPWLKRILGIVGTLALMALTVILYRRTEWSKGFTPDGVMTLVAGVIAFIAVIIQIRSSSKQVQDQIKAQRDAEREEHERQKRAVATAILFEIDLIYRSMIRGTGEAMQNAVGGEFVVKPHSLHFTVYEGNAGNIGQLPASLGQDIVGLYGSITRILITLQVYSDAVRNAHEPPGNIDWKAMASQYYEQTVKAIPQVRLLSYLVSRRLCEYTGVEFTPPTIAVAAENLTDLQELVKKM
jgi:hypothetical protein